MRKRTYVLWKKILIVATVLLTVVALLYVYFGTNTFLITTYAISGVPEEKVPELQARLVKISEERVFKIIPTNRIFTYRSLKMRAAIKEALPDTGSVDIKLASLHTLKVEVTPYNALFRLDNAQAITKEGYVYPESEDISTLPLIVIASSTLTSETKDGIMENKLMLQDGTTTEAVFGEIVNILPKINSVLFPVTAIHVSPEGDILLFAKDKKSSVKISQGVDMDKQWSNVISAIDTEPLKSLLQNEKERLEYIDVRFGNKVFYKFTKGGQTAIISDTYATSTASTTAR